jgi:nucleotide-binding universal stress UspA family protein
MAGKKKFLVAVDGSEGSKAVVEYVAAILPPVDTEVVLFHVFNRIPESYWDFGQGIEVDSLSKRIKKQVEAHESSMKNFMNDAKKILLEANFREEHISRQIKDRSVGIARDIVAEAHRGYAGLILGCTGSGKMEGLAVGSVSTKILGTLSDIPICIVAGAPAGRHLIVAFDGSPGSMRAVDAVCSLLNGFKGKIFLYHALRNLAYADPSIGRVPAFEEVEKLIWGEVESMLEPTLIEAEQRLLKAGRGKDEVITKIVTGVSSRAGALVEEADQSGCGSIIVGRTGISQVEDFNIGRVANKVVHKAKNQAVWIIP